MSYPGGDWIPPDNGDFGGNGAPQRRLDPSSLAIFAPDGRLVGVTQEQIERNLSQLSPPGFSALPQAPFWYGEQRQKTVVAKVLAMHAAVLNRPLTASEADAIAYHRSRSCKILGWRTPVIVLSTALMVYRGRRTFKFPFYTPKPASFNPFCFPTARRPLVTGAVAATLWHTARLGAYGTVFGLTVTPLFVSLSETSYLVNMLQDPRLKDLRDSINQQHRHQPPHAHAHTHTHTHTHTQTRPGGGPPHRASSSPDTPDALDDSAIQTTAAAQAASAQLEAAMSQLPPEPPAADDDDFFSDDDASPVAPSARRQQQQSGPYPTQRPAGRRGAGGGAGTGEGGGGGSAWDRLRQRASSGQDDWDRAGQSAEEARIQRQDQYTYAQGDREKARAREQAQREFDAMLERERRGQGESGVRGG